MNCQEYQEAASRFVDAELPGEEASVLFAHLSTCMSCREFLTTALRLRTAIASTPDQEVPSSLDQRVLNIIGAGRSAVPQASRLLPRLWRQRVFVPLPAAIAAVVAFCILSVSVWFFTRQEIQRERPRVMYIMSMQPIDVQGSYHAPEKSIQ